MNHPVGRKELSREASRQAAAAVIDQTLAAVCDVDLAFNRRQSGLGEETLILKGNFLLKIIISSIKKCQGDTNRATILSP